MKKEIPLSLAIFLFLISACNSTERKTKLDNIVHIHIDTSQRIFESDELLIIHNKNVADFKKNFKDSTIFIMGYIRYVDAERGEILLKNSYEGSNVVCLLKDSTILSLLRRSDKVLFRGICKAVGGDGLILIANCELAQLSPDKIDK